MDLSQNFPNNPRIWKTDNKEQSFAMPNRDILNTFNILYLVSLCANIAVNSKGFWA